MSLRSHGWDRDLSKETQVKLQKECGVSEFNALYTFYYSGFNFRSTDLQAYIGLAQIDKLDDWGRKRSTNFNLYQELIIELINITLMKNFLNQIFLHSH